MARIRVIRGRPTDVELAAVLVALTPVTAPAADEDGTSGWLRAGLVESHGRTLVAQVADLDRPGGW